MAAPATQLISSFLPAKVEADWFRVGTAQLEQTAEKHDGQMLSEQVLFPLERESQVAVRYLVAAPVGQFFSQPSARPDFVQFGALNDPEYRLAKPIPLEVSLEESVVVVTWADIDEFGTGETLSAAISDFARSLRELYRRLRETYELGPDLAKVKRTLDEYIQDRPR